jgi:predicted ATP-grasp superfamily ATP-dependent carboligase
MKRILITGAGGSPAINFTRSLRKAPEKFYLVGTDADKFYLQRAETDARYLVPLAREADYLTVLNDIIEKEKIEFVHAQNDVEVNFLSENREKVNAKLLLPSKETVKICQDKFLSFEKWEAAGIKVPKTYIITNHEELQQAFDEFGGHMWIRATSGAGGRGSLPVHDMQTAINWLDFQKGWDGTFTASELLRDDTVTWMSIWHEGKLVVAQGRRRLYWELGKISPSGVTGATGGGETVSDPELDKIAEKTVLTIDSKPEGLFGVDMAYDQNGVPNPTEINIGRFFTTHQFFTELGLNMPYIFVKLAYGETPPPIKQKLNPAPNNMVWIRGIDFEPVLASMKDIDKEVTALEARRKALKK